MTVFEARRSLVLESVILALFAVLMWGVLTESVFDWLPVIQFSVAFLLIESFEVELPRGDASTMSMPVVANAILFLTGLEALFVVVVPTLLIQVMGRKQWTVADAAQVLLRRTTITLAVLWGVQKFGIGWSGGMWSILLLAASVVLLDFIYAQVQSSSRWHAPLMQLLAGSSRLQGTMIAAKVSATLVAAILYPSIGVWGLLVLVILLLVMRQAFLLFISVRKAYQSTIQALARTVEVQDPGKIGHAERVSDLATEAGRQCGYRGRHLERLAYAALLHDLGEVGSDELPDDGVHGDEPSPLSAAAMLEHVSFLADVVPILQLCEQSESAVGSHNDSDLETAYIVTVASRTDDLAGGKPTREDSNRLAVLNRYLNDNRRWRIEDAFRKSIPRFQGALFTADGLESGGESRMA